MTEQLTLSNRLKQITKFLPEGAKFADIGSDHAYLPIAVCLKDPTARAIAGELNQGPYQAAVDHVTKYHLSGQIKVIKGDGLDVIANHHLSQVVIAGMGGSLIRSILERGKDRLVQIERLILQPNVDSQHIREWIEENNYTLVDEVILEEDGHIYEILIADQAIDQQISKLTEQERLFGPFLLKKRDSIFKQKWQSELNNYQRIIKQMERAKQPDLQKINDYREQLSWIERVLSDG